PRGTDVPGREAGRSEFTDSTCCRHDQTRRRGLLHSRPLLSVTAFEVSAGNREIVSAAARDAHGRTARGHLARTHPEKSWLYTLHRGPRSRRTWQGHRREALLRTL